MTDVGDSSTTWVAAVEVGWAAAVVVGSESPRVKLMTTVTSATTSTTAARTPSARPPGVARTIGGGATGSGPFPSRAPHASQCRLYEGFWVPHEGHGTVVTCSRTGGGSGEGGVASSAAGRVGSAGGPSSSSNGSKRSSNESILSSPTLLLRDLVCDGGFLRSAVPQPLAIVPRIMEIRALQEAEAWTGLSIAAGVVLLVVTIVLLAWAIRRFLRG